MGYRLEQRLIDGFTPLTSPRSNVWYHMWGSSTTAAMTQNEVRAIPLWLPQGSYNALGAETTGAGEAGSVIRLGVYADDGNGYPSSLLVDAGTIAGDGATAFKTVSINLTLAAGWYWLAGVAQLCPATPPTVRVSSQGNPAIVTSTSPGATTSVAFSGTSASGALNSTFGSPTRQGNTIRVAIRGA